MFRGNNSFGYDVGTLDPRVHLSCPARLGATAGRTIARFVYIRDISLPRQCRI